MKYKMVVCDLDDTLIDSEGSGDYISEFTLSTIAEYMERGGIFTVSTGRNMGSLLKKVELLGISGRDIPLMSLNGTYVINGKTLKTMRDIYIDYDTALNVCLECERLGLHYHMYDKEYAYVTDMYGASKAYLEYTKSPAIEVAKISDYLMTKKPMCMKLLIMGEPELLERVSQSLAKKFENLNFLTSNKYLIEIISRESGKGNALKFVSKEYDIPLEEIMAIGDSMNDYSMIQAAGLGVAMGNACCELKQIADYITDPCKQDGAAKSIKKFCLKATEKPLAQDKSRV